MSLSGSPVIGRASGDHTAGSPRTGGPRSGHSHIVVYDGECAVCNRFVKLLHRWDRHQQVEMIAFQDPTVVARFPWIPQDAYRQAMQLIGPGGRTWQGAAAIEELLHVLPRGRAIGWIFRLPFVGALADRFYRWFARNRYRFGCGEHCSVAPHP